MSTATHVCTALACAGLSALGATYDASTGYVTQINGGNYGDSPLYDDAMTKKKTPAVYYWSDYLGAHSGTNYYCTGGRGPLAMSSAFTTNYVFKGDRLVLKANANLSLKNFYASRLTVKDFVLLEGSMLSYNENPSDKPPSIVAGKLTIQGTASKPSALRVVNSATTAGASIGESIWLESKLVGDENACLCVRSAEPDKNQPHLGYGYLWLQGDTTDYHGTIRVTMTNELVVGASGLPNGSVTMIEHAALSCRHPESSTLSIKALTADATTKVKLAPTNSLAFGSLALAAGSRIEVAAADGKVGSVRVTDACACAFPLRISATSDGVAVGRTRFFSCPKAQRTLTAGDFDFQYGVGGYSPTAKITVEEEGDESVAYITLNGCVHLVKGDPNTNTDYLSSAMTNALAWSDGQLPHAGADYIVAPTNAQGQIYRSDSKNVTVLRQPQVNGSEKPSNTVPTTYKVFPGDSLTIGGGSKDGDTLYLMNGELFVSDLRLATGSTLRFKDGQDSTIKGKITVYPHSTSTTYAWFRAYFGNKQTVESELCGEGNILVKGDAGSMHSEGHLYLMNHNTNYTGRLIVTMDNNKRADGKISPSIEQDRVAYLYVNYPESLGGPLGAFTYNSLVIEQMSVFSPLREMTLAEPTRGILVNGCGRFLVPEGADLTVTSTITHNGLLRKEGGGVLRLGSRPYFFDNGKLITTPLSGTNAVRVVAGSLEAISTNAFDGLAVTFDAGTAWRVAYKGETDLSRWGAVNALGSFAPTAADGKIRISFDIAEPYLGTDFDVALCTVTQEQANVLKGRLILDRPYRGGRATLTEVGRGNGLVTLVAQVTHPGLWLFVK